MKILHTSDWHLGKNLENISRIEEQKQFIDWLCGIAEKENVDMVIIAGDIYDTYNPPAAAEELFYQALNRLGDDGKRAVLVIAGNHDNPDRLCAAGQLAYKSGIILLGYPSSDAGVLYQNNQYIKIVRSGAGWFEISMKRCQQNAVVIALPYPSESRLEELISRQLDEKELAKQYSEKVADILKSLARNFREDTVNICTAHVFMKEGMTSDSERAYQVGGAYTVDPSSLPANANFVALGHLHRPQEVKNAPCTAYYSGSPLAYSFSEAEHSKAVYIVEAAPGIQTTVKPIYVQCGKPLRRWMTSSIEEVLEWCIKQRDINAWVDVEIHTDRFLTVEEQKQIRTLHKGIINIRPKIVSQSFDDNSCLKREGKSIDELFKEFYRFRTGNDVPEEIMKVFVELLNEESNECLISEETVTDGDENYETEAS